MASKEFLEGFAAQQHGKLLSDNPYVLNRNIAALYEQYYQWKEGWERARDTPSPLDE